MKRIALVICASIVTLHCGKNYDELFHEGVELRKNHKWSLAKKKLFEAAEKKATAEVYKELGNVFLLGEQNIGEAENYYQKSLVVNPKYINAEFNMAVIQLKKYELTLDNKGQGDAKILDAAHTWFQRVYEQDPNFSIGIEEMAKYYYYKRDYKKALETAQRAVGLDNRNANAYSVLGQIYFSGLKDYKQAFDNFDQARSLNNNDTDVVYFLWATSVKLNKKEDATQFKMHYEQRLEKEGLTKEQVQDRVKRLENQLRGG
ncbi:MAG TPA: hypothetical protein PLY93_05550 [Turneriella sp.]|nr:hypothetical protein [Turneriella sp.]